jgi:hypothetical protein
MNDEAGTTNPPALVVEHRRVMLRESDRDHGFTFAMPVRAGV